MYTNDREEEAFVYCWTDHKTEKLYIGSHKGSELDGYICSSKIMIEEYNARPDDFTREIIARGTYIDIRNLESHLLKSSDAAKSSSFYNMNNGDGKFARFGPLTQEAKDKISQKLKGRTMSPEWREKMRNAKLGTHRSMETKQKISASMTGTKRPPEVIEKISRGRQITWNKKRGII